MSTDLYSVSSINVIDSASVGKVGRNGLCHRKVGVWHPPVSLQGDHLSGRYGLMPLDAVLDQGQVVEDVHESFRQRFSPRCLTEHQLQCRRPRTQRTPILVTM